MRTLITAGPTREFIDDVRYISNASTGRMGCALARAAKEAGDHVTLVCGHLECEAPEGDTLIPVVSAKEMHDAVLHQAPKADVVIMAAAVADYRPAERPPGKRKKARRELVLPLPRTPDILAELGRQKGEQVLVGFALDVENRTEAAVSKLRSKNLDLVVANSPAAIGAQRATVELIFASGESETLENRPKSEIARRIIAAVRRMAADSAAENS